jgi:hypothetical protein
MYRSVSSKKICTFEGAQYSHGSELCTSTRCLRCDDGQWLTSQATDRERDFMDWL